MRNEDEKCESVWCICFIVKDRKSQVLLATYGLVVFVWAVSHKMHFHLNYDSLATHTVNFVVL